MKVVLKFLKNVILSSFILYGYNLIAANFNMMIPINLYTVLFISMLGAPGVAALVFFKILVL